MIAQIVKKAITFQISGIPDQRRIGTVDLWLMKPRQHRLIMMSQRKSQRAAESYGQFVSLDIKIPSYLPNFAIIPKALKVAGMVWVSDLGGVDPGRDSADHYRLAPSITGLMYRYAAGSENFWLRDKFRIIADICSIALHLTQHLFMVINSDELHYEIQLLLRMLADQFINVNLKFLCLFHCFFDDFKHLLPRFTGEVILQSPQKATT